MKDNERFIFFDSFIKLRDEMIEQLLHHQIKTDWPVFDHDKDVCELKTHQYQAIKSIIKEVVSNVIRHSQASLFSVETQVTNLGLQLKLLDNGIGITPKNIHFSKGFGLINIGRIIQDVRGIYKISSSEEGTEVTVFIQL